MKTLLLIVWAGLSAIRPLAETNRTVVPDGFEDKSGNSAVALFSTLIPTVQQLFRASASFPDGSSPVLIHEIAFRITDGAASFSATIPHIDIRLSTSARTLENMSAFWSQNKGSDDALVFSKDNMNISAQGGFPVNPFDVVFTLDKPFYFDPNHGNLLMYIENTGASGTRSLDAHEFASLSSSPFATSSTSRNPNDPPSMPAAGGLVTRFGWTSIPEPSQLFLTVSGAAIMCVSRLLKRKA